MHKVINFAFEKFQPEKNITLINPISLRNGLSSIFNKPNPKNDRTVSVLLEIGFSRNFKNNYGF
jgi:hypothetical protein